MTAPVSVWASAGVHVAPPGRNLADLGPFPGDQPVRVCVLGPTPGKAELLDGMAAALELPDWFGRNWDALIDSLAELPATILVIDGFDRLDLLTADVAVEILAQAALASARRRAPLSVVLTGFSR